jgi:tetratricopeptide (TPR) repeat protein
LELTGPNGLLKLFTKNVLETALNEEMTEHLGHEKNHAESGRESTNVRNGSRGKTVISDAAGEVQIDVPRDRESTFEPQIVKKRQRRLTEVDEIVISLYAKGMTTGEISAHFADIYGASVSKETISRITDKVVTEMTEWSTRPLDSVYAAVFIDAIVVKVWDGRHRAEVALDHAVRALDHYLGTGHRRGQATALNTIAWLEIQLGQAEAALDHGRRALRLQEEDHEERGQADALDTLAGAYHQVGRHDRAVDCYRRALSLYRSSGDRRNEAVVLSGLAETFHATGALTDARSAWEKAFTLYDDLRLPEADSVRARLDAIAPLTN